MKLLRVEIYKTLNELNPSFIKNIFTVKETDRLSREQYKLNLNTPSYNQMTFGYKNLRIFGPNIWNKLPYHIKSRENLKSFKELIKNWDGARCSCKFANRILTFWHLSPHLIHMFLKIIHKKSIYAYIIY